MKIKEVTKKFEDLRKEVAKLGKAAFVEEFQPLFKKYPQVLAVQWNQYTPSWNDGDACTFGVNTARIKVEKGGDFLEDYEFEDDDLNAKVAEEFENLRSIIEEEIFLITFGDGVDVTISRNGRIKVEDCDHD